jgi:hypothetical protein
MKILEQVNTGGFGHPAKIQERVRELADGETVPVGARPVPDATPLQDWTGLGTAFIAPEPEPEPADEAPKKKESK